MTSTQSVNTNTNKPFVSICTPTFNRRPFIPYAIKCLLAQDYPLERLEWIIVDDGTDKIGDLVQNQDWPFKVKYFALEEKKSLGYKRNFMNKQATGDILVYWDDDDYYPPQRISHAVTTLVSNNKALCVGSSTVYIYYKHLDKIVQFGPYGPNHATAATFAFKRKLLEQTSFDDKASLAEEKSFLKDYTIPFNQLNPKKSILVFSHNHNSFDKRRLLDNPNPNFVKETNLQVSDLISDPDIRDFYMNRLDGLLQDYEPGRPNMKPDVIKQMVKIEKERRHIIAQMQKQQLQQQAQQPMITLQRDGQAPIQLTMEQVVELLQQQQKQLAEQHNIIQRQQTQIQVLKAAAGLVSE